MEQTANISTVFDIYLSQPSDEYNIKVHPEANKVFIVKILEFLESYK